MSNIEWTGRTWNPIVGCTKISPGCKHCYASKDSPHRFASKYEGPGLITLNTDPRRPGLTYVPSERVSPEDRSGRTVMEEHEDGTLTVSLGKGAQWTGEIRCLPWVLDVPLRRRKPTTYFVNSLSDLFHEALVDCEEGRRFVAAIFGVMAACPQHTFQLLTKRPDKAREWFEWLDESLVETMRTVAEHGKIGEVFSSERWAYISDFHGYEVSTHGRVRSWLRKDGGRARVLRADASPAGHRRVCLYRDGEQHKRLVHRLVLDTFGGGAGEQVRHLDGDPGNNNLWNLVAGDQSSNWSDRARHGNRRSYTKITREDAAEIRRLRLSKGLTYAQLGERFGISDTQVSNICRRKQWKPEPEFAWPIRQVWIGTSVEDQPRADERIPELLRVPAAVRFLSCEPLLGSVDIGKWIEPGCPDYDRVTGSATMRGPRLDWVIAGGESGPGARPMHPDWARGLRDQCTDAGVPFFFKQWGAWTADLAAAGVLMSAGGPLPRMFKDAKDGILMTTVVEASHKRDEGKRVPYAMLDGEVRKLYRVGKKKAGRQLDGRTWDQMPERPE